MPNPELLKVVEPLDLRQRANEVGNGIVLISDMHDGVDWKAVAKALLDATDSTNYCCHVLDLRELQRLVSLSDGRPAKLEFHLLNRWKLMAQNGSAAVRTLFAPGPKSPTTDASQNR